MLWRGHDRGSRVKYYEGDRRAHLDGMVGEVRFRLDRYVWVDLVGLIGSD